MALYCYNLLAGSVSENVTKLSFASERMQAAERAHNFVNFYLQTTSTVSELLRCRSPFRPLPSSPIRRTLMQMRCWTVAINLRRYRSLWATTILAVERPTYLFVASHWLERSSCRIQSSRSQYFTSTNHLSCGFCLNFLLKTYFGSLHTNHTSSDRFLGRDVTRRG